jgi:UDP-N-acetylglucosamine 4,6-dehydratase/5-epimerase
MNFLDNSSVLITGGTGSFGQAALKKLLQEKVRRIAVFSRDELKQLEMKKVFQDDRVRFFVGDIRDSERLDLALHGVDYVIHAAALKQVDTGEYNPMEFVKTNVIGSQNVIDACVRNGIKKVVALSTDKASSPINLYGATKLTADKLFSAANNYSHSYGTTFSVVRYGNVMGSRGSVIPFFRELIRRGKPLPVTDKRMTRFWITMEHAVGFVLESFELMQGGELYVPKIPSMKIIDLANAMAEKVELVEIGIRPGEKLHEEMISPDDSRRTIQLNNRFVVSPIFAEWGYKEPVGEKVEDGFVYRSDSNDLWLTKQDIQDRLNEMHKSDSVR